MARKPLNIWAEQRRPEFEKRLAAYSLQALQTVIDLSQNAFDPRVRLQASTYLLDKILGKDFSLCREQPAETSTITINVIPVGSDTTISPEDAELIRRAEAGEQSIALPGQDGEAWDIETDGESWGSDTYDPDPS